MTTTHTTTSTSPIDTPQSIEKILVLIHTPLLPPIAFVCSLLFNQSSIGSPPQSLSSVRTCFPYNASPPPPPVYSSTRCPVVCSLPKLPFSAACNDRLRQCPLLSGVSTSDWNIYFRIAIQSPCFVPIMCVISSLCCSMNSTGFSAYLRKSVISSNFFCPIFYRKNSENNSGRFGELGSCGLNKHSENDTFLLPALVDLCWIPDDTCLRCERGATSVHLNLCCCCCGTALNDRLTFACCTTAAVLLLLELSPELIPVIEFIYPKLVLIGIGRKLIIPPFTRWWWTTPPPPTLPALRLLRAYFLGPIICLVSSSSLSSSSSSMRSFFSAL